MKRIFAFVLIAVLICLVLSSCSVVGKDQDTETVNKELTGPDETAAAEMTESPTEAIDFKQLYTDFLDSADIDYYFGSLIYLNDDDVPELVLQTMAASEPAYVCYIYDGEVGVFETYGTAGFTYAEREGAFITGAMHQGYYAWMMFIFDGTAVNEEHSGSAYENEFTVDSESVNEEEYNKVYGSYEFRSFPESISKSDLIGYIDSF